MTNSMHARGSDGARWVAKFAAIGATFAILLLPLTTVAQEYHVRAHGQFTCKNNGVDSPLAFARVELMDSDSDTDTLPDDLLGVTYTNANGEFSVDGVGGDGGNYSWSRPDVYARVILSDEDGPQGVRLTDELNRAKSFATPQHDHDNSEGDVDIGAWWWGTQAGSADNASACGIWLNSRKAFTDYVSLTHELPPAGHYDIEYWAGVWAGEVLDPTPWTNLDTTHWPRHYHTGLVNTHEFAHSVRHSFDGDGNHFNYDVVRFLYAQHHSPCTSIDHPSQGFAFNEGWAEFWSGQVSSYCRTPPNFSDEGDVAGGLAELVTHPGVDRTTMLTVLRTNPGGIHSYQEFCNAIQRQVPGSCLGVGHNPLAITTSMVRESGPPRAAQLEWLRMEINAQKQVVSTLAKALSRARARAATTSRACNGVDCQAAFNTLAEPAFIEGAIRIRELAIRRLARLVEPAGSSVNSRQRVRGDSQYQKAKDEYLQQIRVFGVASLSKALHNTRELALSNPTAADLAERLKRRIAVNSGTADLGSLPAGWQPDFTSDEQVGRTPIRQEESGHLSPADSNY